MNDTTTTKTTRCSGAGIRVTGIPASKVVEKPSVSTITGQDVLLPRAFVSCPQCGREFLTAYGTKKSVKGVVLRVDATVPPHSPHGAKTSVEMTAEEVERKVRALLGAVEAMMNSSDPVTIRQWAQGVRATYLAAREGVTSTDEVVEEAEAAAEVAEDGLPALTDEEATTVAALTSPEEAPVEVEATETLNGVTYPVVEVAKPTPATTRRKRGPLSKTLEVAE